MARYVFGLAAVLALLYLTFDESLGQGKTAKMSPRASLASRLEGKLIAMSSDTRTGQTGQFHITELTAEKYSERWERAKQHIKVRSAYFAKQSDYNKQLAEAKSNADTETQTAIRQTLAAMKRPDAVSSQQLYKVVSVGSDYIELQSGSGNSTSLLPIHAISRVVLVSDVKD